MPPHDRVPRTSVGRFQGESLVFTRRRDQGRRKDDLDTENCTKGHKASLKSLCNSRRRGAVIVAFSLPHRDAYLVGGFGQFQNSVPQSQATTRRQLIQCVLSSSFKAAAVSRRYSRFKQSRKLNLHLKLNLRFNWNWRSATGLRLGIPSLVGWELRGALIPIVEAAGLGAASARTGDVCFHPKSGHSGR